MQQRFRPSHLTEGILGLPFFGGSGDLKTKTDIAVKTLSHS
jgi:hypothetical protein